MQTRVLVFVIGSFLTPAFGQVLLPETGQQQQTADPQATDQQQAADQQPAEAQRSAIDVKPGEQALKEKDLWERTGYFHPFRRMPKFVIRDQKAIWSSPFHTSKSDIKWWVILGATTGALIATDKYTARHLPNDSTQTHLGADFSTIGAAYTLIPLGASFYFLGTAAHSDRLRETGLLSFETLLDTTIIETVLKVSLQRARPLEGNGKGGFWDSNTKWYNASFPSGHAINTWGMASIFAHQYRHKKWVPFLAYGLAATVSGARVAGRNHFIGDTIAGSAMGWFIGDYVYWKRHNSDLEKKALRQRILDHVHVGAVIQ